MVFTMQHHSLPLSQSPDSITQIAETQWVSTLQHLDPAEVSQLLVERWKDLTNSSYRDLAQLVQDGEPRSVVVANGICWLTVYISKYIASDLGVTTFPLYVRRPFSEDEAAHCLERFDLSSNTRRDMIALIQDFGGLRDQEPGHAGSFLEPPVVEPVGVWCEGSDIGEAAAFPILYDAANGDLLGVFPDGRTGWYCTEDLGVGCPVRPFGRDISDTVSKWANCNDYIDGCIYFDDDWRS